MHLLVAASVRLHGTRPWHLKKFHLPFEAANVKLHGARPWHLGKLAGFLIAASVSLHGARPWHHLSFTQAR